MKKQTKPEAFLDHYLSTVGLWRKPLARDGLSLFRAVSEQLFMTQVYHTNLYEACRIVFLHLGKDPEIDWTETEVIGILSRMYRRSFLIYESVGQPPVEAASNSYPDKIVLCRVGETQLDSVYPLSFQEDAALCQSIIYEVLYRRVFKLDKELTEAVDLIRDQNRRKVSLISNRFDDLQYTCVRKFQDWHLNLKDRQLRKPSPPVPYRIAKALDPSIYRNVELDIWEEEKREQIKKSPEYKDRFSPGDKCQVILEGAHYHGHIQEISASENTAIVYIHELGEKKCVSISSLKTPHSRHNCLSHSKDFRRKQDMPVASTGGAVYYNGTAYKYPSSLPQHNYIPVQGYNVQTAYSYQPEVMSGGSTSYVGMDAVPVHNSLNNVKSNMNQFSPPGMIPPYGLSAMMPQANIANQFMYNSVVPANNPGYCVFVPYLDSIAVKDVNMNCLPSQDSSEVNTLRFFYNFGVENYRVYGQGSQMVQGMEMVPPNGMMADQLNGSAACANYPAPYPVYYPAPGSYSGAQTYMAPPGTLTQPTPYPAQLCSAPPQGAQVLQTA